MRKLILAAVAMLTVAAAVVLFVAVLPTYNALIARDEAVAREWANIDALLQQRYSVLPSLSAAVKSAQGQEKEMFLPIADAHSGYNSATGRAEKIAAAQKTDKQIAGVRSWFMRYPDLKSQANVTVIMNQLAALEAKIAEQRMGYNQVVSDLNTAARTLPGQVVTRFTSIERAVYYRPSTEMLADPGINLGGDARSSASRDEGLVQEQAKNPPIDAPRVSHHGKDPAALTFRGTVGSPDGYKAVLEFPGGKTKVVEVDTEIEGYDATVMKVDAGQLKLEMHDGKSVTLSVK